MSEDNSYDYNQIRYRQQTSSRETDHSLPGHDGYTPQQIQNYASNQILYTDSSHFHQPPPPSSFSSTVDDRQFDQLSYDIRTEAANRRYLEEQYQQDLTTQNLQRDLRNTEEQVRSECIASIQRENQQKEERVSAEIRHQDICESISRAEQNAALWHAQPSLEACHIQERNGQMQAAEMNANALLNESINRNVIRKEDIRRLEDSQQIQADTIRESEFRTLASMYSESDRIRSASELRRIESDLEHTDLAIRQLQINNLQADEMESSRLSRILAISALGQDREMGASRVQRVDAIPETGNSELDKVRLELDFLQQESDRIMAVEVTRKLTQDQIVIGEIEANRLSLELEVRRLQCDRISAVSLEQELGSRILETRRIETDLLRTELTHQSRAFEHVLAEESRAVLERDRNFLERTNTERLQSELGLVEEYHNRVSATGLRLEESKTREESERRRTEQVLKELERARDERERVFSERVNAENEVKLIAHDQLEINRLHDEADSQQNAGLKICSRGVNEKWGKYFEAERKRKEEIEKSNILKTQELDEFVAGSKGMNVDQMIEYLLKKLGVDPIDAGIPDAKAGGMMASDYQNIALQDQLKDLADRLFPYPMNKDSYKLVVVPAKTKLASVGGENKIRHKWGGFPEEDYSEYLSGNQVSEKNFGGEEPVICEITLREPTLAMMSQIKPLTESNSDAGVPPPMRKGGKFQYWNPRGFQAYDDYEPLIEKRMVFKKDPSGG